MGQKINMKKKRVKSSYIATRVHGFYVGIAIFCVALLVILWWIIIHFRAGTSPVLVASAITLIGVILFIRYYFYVLIPYQYFLKELTLFSKGYSVTGIKDLTVNVSPETEELMRHFSDMLTSRDAVAQSKRQAQYLAMQNQINPHFLYNTLEGIRGEAIISGNESIGMMAEALSKYFRYTISNLDRFVTIEDELANAKNYFSIQQFRFGDRISLAFAFDQDDDTNDVILGAKVPKLIIQPLVENAVIHGVENVREGGVVTIRIQATSQRLIVTVSDNGDGIEPEILRKLNRDISNVHKRDKLDNTKSTGVALHNVNSRIRLLFGDEYGLTIMSSVGIGTDAEITIPYLTHYEDIEA
ncbi:MAG: histidine kinase [Clostridiales Family XIII bacterium]|jgi:two-component system sensor histidine kinase YesM|nr:histidine kinase [Clostridiales Family XIII bacterium]